MGATVCAGGISGYLEGKNVGRSRGGLLEYETVGGFLADIRKEFREDKEVTKVTELKRLEQGGKTMEEFMQEF